MTKHEQPTENSSSVQNYMTYGLKLQCTLKVTVHYKQTLALTAISCHMQFEYNSTLLYVK